MNVREDVVVNDQGKVVGMDSIDAGRRVGIMRPAFGDGKVVLVERASRSDALGRGLGTLHLDRERQPPRRQTHELSATFAEMGGVGAGAGVVLRAADGVWEAGAGAAAGAGVSVALAGGCAAGAGR